MRATAMNTKRSSWVALRLRQSNIVKSSEASLWMALRAGVLRRAASCPGAAQSRRTSARPSVSFAPVAGAVPASPELPSRQGRHAAPLANCGAGRCAARATCGGSLRTRTSASIAAHEHHLRKCRCSCGRRGIQWVQRPTRQGLSLLANRSLNRTHCGVRPEAHAFIPRLSPHPATSRAAQTFATRTTGWFFFLRPPDISTLMPTRASALYTQHRS